MPSPKFQCFQWSHLDARMPRQRTVQPAFEWGIHHTMAPVPPNLRVRVDYWPDLALQLCVPAIRSVRLSTWLAVSRESDSPEVVHIMYRAPSKLPNIVILSANFRVHILADDLTLLMSSPGDSHIFHADPMAANAICRARWQRSAHAKVGFDGIES